MRRLLRWLGLAYSPSREFEKAGREIADGWAEDIRKVQEAQALLGAGWDLCTYMRDWDSRYAALPEPDRWIDFACPAHREHAWIVWVSPERVYLGRGVA
jgi:hypothetical protein